MRFAIFNKSFATLLVLAPVVAASIDSIGADDGTTILLESFDNPKHEWKEMNDPVMGGRSTGTFTIADNVGRFEGEVRTKSN